MASHQHKTPVNQALRVAIFKSEETQRAIARRARMDETRLSKIIRGRGIPTDNELKRLARVLRCRPSELLPEAVAS